MSAKTDKLKAALEARGFKNVRVWYAGVNDGYVYTHADDVAELPQDHLGYTFDDALAWINGIPNTAERFPGWPGLSPDRY